MKFLSQINVNTEYALPIVDGANGQVLTTDGSGAVYWGSVSIGALNLDGLQDVVITTPTSGQILRYGIPVGSGDQNPVWYNWTPNFVTTANAVTITGTQTITGSKTFTAATTMSIASGNDVALTITKGGSHEALYINKTSGSGNAVTIVGTLEATTIVKTGGTSSQFLKADGSVDTNTYLTSYTETQTLDAVTDLGNTTTNAITVGGLTSTSVTTPLIESSGLLIIDADTSGGLQPDQGDPAVPVLSFDWQGSTQGYIDTDGKITFNGFKTPSGTSSQFLKANGTVDSNVYITSAALSGYATQTWVNSNFYNQGQIDDFFYGNEPILGYNKTNWDTAYDWGNHDEAGYLTSFTETDPTVPDHVKAITETQISDWDRAYNWGNHADYGYAPIASPSFTGTPSAPTAAAGTNTTQIATTAFVRTEITNLVDAAPATLDTLNELAAALGDDPNFATTVADSIATKVPQTRTLTINGTALDLSADRSWTIDSADGYVSNVRLVETTLTFEGEGNAFAGDIDLSTLPFAPQGSYLTAEADTLATVTSRGATTNGNIVINGDATIQNSGYLRLIAGSSEMSGFTVFNSAQNGYLSNRITTSDHSSGWGWELTSSTATDTDAGVYFRIGYGGAVSYLNSGNFGIGKTNPTYTLDVGGSLRTTGSITVDSGNQITLDQNYTVHGYLQFSAATFGGESAFGMYGYYGIALNTRQGAGVIIRGDSGNVGIGTTEPSTKLHVDGVIKCTDGTSTDWNTAYGWGNHASAGYSNASNLSSGTVPYARTNKVLPTSGNYVWDASTPAGDYEIGVQTSFVNAALGFPEYGAVLHIGARGATDAGGDFQIYCGHGSANGGNHLRFRNADNNANPSDSWTAFKIIWDSENLVNNQDNWNTAYGWGNNYISDVRLTESNLEFTGEGSAFTGTIDLSTLPFAASSHTHSASDITSGTLSTDRLPKQELGISIVGNFGQWQPHSTYGNFNTDVAYWGWNFVQGNTSAPHTASEQWYRGRFSLGSEYGFGNVSGDYWMEIAIPRYNQNNNAGNLFVRTCESGTINAWQGVRAAYATDASYATTSGNSVTTSQTNFSELFIEDSPVATKEYVTSQGYITGSYLPLTGGTLSGAVVVNLGNVTSDTVAFKVGGPSNYDSLTIGMEDSPDYDAFIASYGNDIRFYSGKGLSSENHSFYWFTSKAGTSQHSSVAMVLDHNQALSVTGVINASGGNSTNWNTAYGWGDHADTPYWNVELTDDVTVAASSVRFGGNVRVDGDLEVLGTITETSSIRFNENITPLDPALDKVNQLEAVSYNKIGVDDREIGLIAEDVAELFPEVVTYNEEGQPQGIQYQRLSVILLKAVQELSQEVNELKKKLN